MLKSYFSISFEKIAPQVAKYGRRCILRAYHFNQSLRNMHSCPWYMVSSPSQRREIYAKIYSSPHKLCGNSNGFKFTNSGHSSSLLRK